MSAKISLGGEDRTADLLPRVRADGTEPDQPACADSLAAAADEEAYLDELIRLLREQEAARTESVEIPRSPGWAGGILWRVRRLLWKLFRYQHEHMAQQHNAIHSMQAAAIEFERTLTRAKLEQMEKRIAALERARSDNLT